MIPLTDYFKRSFEPYRGEYDEPFKGGRKSPAAAASSEAPLWEPLVDVIETDAGFVVYAAIPGVLKESIRVEVNERVVKITGERKPLEGTPIARELPYGRFERSFRFPYELDAAKVEASCRDGLLELRIAKPAAQGREVPVR